MEREVAVCKLRYVFSTILGMTLMVSGLGHLQNPNAFFIALMHYRILHETTAWFASLLLPWLQLLLASNLLLGISLKPTAIVAAIIFVIFTIAQGIVIFRRDEINCGCFGVFIEEKIGLWSLLRTISLLLLSLAIIGLETMRSFPKKALTRSPASVHSGVTVIEIVVTLAIISICFALLLPSISSARESARIMVCQSRLRELGLAVQSHNSTFKHFPTNGWGGAWIGLHDRGFDKRQPGGWLFNITQFLELGAIRDLAPSSTSPISADQFQSWVNIGSPVLYCPSRGGDTVLPSVPIRSYVIGGQIRTFARTDYGICGGTIRYASGFGPESLEIAEEFVWPVPLQADGVSYQRSEVIVSAVTDGLPYVIVAGEKWAPRQLVGNEGFNQPWMTGDTFDNRRFTTEIPRRDGSPNGDPTIFGAPHVSGVNLVFADGSTRTIGYSIHPKIYITLGGINDGAVSSIE